MMIVKKKKKKIPAYTFGYNHNVVPKKLSSSAIFTYLCQAIAKQLTAGLGCWDLVQEWTNTHAHTPRTWSTEPYSAKRVSPINIQLLPSANWQRHGEGSGRSMWASELVFPKEKPLKTLSFSTVLCVFAL